MSFIEEFSGAIGNNLPDDELIDTLISFRDQNPQEDLPALLNAPRHYLERTVLHTAAENLRLKLVDKLLELGANPFKRDKDGATALALATRDLLPRHLQARKGIPARELVSRQALIVQSLLNCHVGLLDSLSINESYPALEKVDFKGQIILRLRANGESFLHERILVFTPADEESNSGFNFSQAITTSEQLTSRLSSDTLLRDNVMRACEAILSELTDEKKIPLGQLKNTRQDIQFLKDLLKSIQLSIDAQHTEASQPAKPVDKKSGMKETVKHFLRFGRNSGAASSAESSPVESPSASAALKQAPSQKK